MRKKVKIEPFSVIKYFKQIEAHIKKIDEYPLNIDNLHIQSDAYSRLDDDFYEVDINNQYIPFASLEYTARKDSEFSFRIGFFQQGIIFVFMESFFFHILYDEFYEAENEKMAADQTIEVLRMAANGDLFLITTKRHGRLFADEFTYIADGQNKVITTSLDPKIVRKLSKLSKKDDEDDYEIEVQKNNFNIDVDPDGSNIPELLIQFSETYFKKSFPSRIFNSRAVTPLTAKEAFKQLEESTNSADFIKSLNDPSGLSMYKRPEYYITALVIAAVVSLLSFYNILPKNLLNSPALIIIIASFTAAFLSPLINSFFHRNERFNSAEYPSFFKKADEQKVETDLSSKDFEIKKYQKRLSVALKLELIVKTISGALALAVGLIILLNGDKQSSAVIAGLLIWVSGFSQLLLSILVVLKKIKINEVTKFYFWLVLLLIAPIFITPESTFSDNLFALFFIALLGPVPFTWYRSIVSHMNYTKNESADESKKSEDN